MDAGSIATSLQAAASQPWALQESHAPAVSALISDAMMGKDMTGDRLAKAFAANGPLRNARGPELIQTKSGMTAIVSIRGILLYDLDFPPFATSSRKLAADIRALASDESVSRIVLDIASPGGVVTGIPEAAEAIFKARQRKPVAAVANPFAGSAAYWLGAMAGEFAVTASGDVGSLGVFLMHMDMSGALKKAGLDVTFIKAKTSPHKTDGNAFEPLGSDACGHFQSDVDAIGRDFIADVAKGRGLPQSKVRADFGQGRMVMARDALRAGMVDRIATIEQVLASRDFPTRQTARRGTANTGNRPSRSAASRRRLRLQELT